MAKIVRFHQIGGPELLKIEEGPSMGLGKGEAKFRVQAIDLNRAESRFVHGYYLEPTELTRKSRI
jgi:NADPH:quinone reductase-like Zn-dependent oxidoreductase